MSSNDFYGNTHLSALSSFFTEATRRMVVAGVSGALALSLAACGGTGSVSSANAQSESATQATETTQEASAEGAATDDVGGETAETGDYYEVASSFSVDTSDLFSKRDLDPSYDEASATKVKLADSGSTASGAGVEVDGSTVTIVAEGTYVLSGTLSDGRVVVDVDDAAKVQLVLDGAEVTSSTGTALYVRNADKVFLTLAEGSTNKLVAVGEATEEDDHTLDGAVFASDDLTVNGSGSLVVTSGSGNGIVGKDEVTLVSGTIDVHATGHAIEAKDSLAVRDGSYTLSAESDGLHVEHDTNGTKGFAYIAGGTFDISAGDDGIHASNDVVIDGGTLTVSAEDDGIHSEYDLVINNGTIDVSQSYEGLEGARVEMNGGDVHVVASDDGLNAPGEPSETDVNSERETDDWYQRGGSADGQVPEGQAPESMGDGQASEGMGDGQASEGMGDGQAPEGMQDQQQDGQMPEMPQDGQMPEMPQDGQMPEMPQDGQMPEMSQDGQPTMGNGGPMGGGMGGMMMDVDETASLTINGGKLVVEAAGDGLDSNGSLTITGGETYVSGPTNNGNGLLDYGTTATVTGGVLIAVGSSGMAEGFGSDSTQGSLLVSASGEAGDLIQISDAEGNVLANYTAAKQYSCVIATAPGMVEGGTYTLSYGSQSTQVTLDSIAYSNVQGMMGGGMGMRW